MSDDTVELRFSPSSEHDAGTFRLIELPPELCKLIDASDKSTEPILAVKGHPTEDAVVCTADKTYTLRSIVLSNTILVLTPSRTDPNGTVHVRDQLHEVLEVAPCVPRLHTLSVRLQGMVYDEGEDERRATMPTYSYDQARADIQASESELRAGLRDRRVLILDGYLRPIAPAHLTTILSLLLDYLVSLNLAHDAAPSEDLIVALSDAHEIPRDVSEQVMAWFGDVHHHHGDDKDGSSTWTMDVHAVVAEIGLGILREYKHEPVPEREFMRRWKKAVGDAFESAVSLQLLSGNYLFNANDVSGTTLSYLAASTLPTDPAARFAELFLTRPRWKSDEIVPFLSDIAVNDKERDKLLLKYARTVTSPEGTFYTARVVQQLADNPKIECTRDYISYR